MIYSDGVTEAASPADDEFEVEGLAAAVVPHREQPAREIIAEINKAVAAYTCGAPQSDDITLIVARHTAV